MRRFALAIVVMTIACTRGEKPTPKPDPITVAPPSAAPAPVPAPTLSTSAKPAPQEAGAMQVAPVFPTPPTPPGADPEKVRIAADICPAAYFVQGKNTIVGCHAHGPYDKPDHWPTGKLEKMPANADIYDLCAITQIHRGAWTKAGVKQLIVWFDNCHFDNGAGWNGSMPGSAVIVEEVDGHYRSIEYVEGVNLDDCKQTRRPDGKNILLCRSGYAAGTIGATDYFFLFESGRPKTATSIATLYSDIEEINCQFWSPGPFGKVKITNTTLKDRNGDGTADLLIEVERTFTTPTPDQVRKITAGCGDGGPYFSSFLPTAPKKFGLELLSTPDGFEPAAGTKKLLDLWESESPNVTQLKGVQP